MATKGVLMYAYNNDRINYIQLAMVNAKLIKKHMGVPVSIVTDEDGMYYIMQLDPVFDQVIVLDDNAPVNHRTYRDTIYHAVQTDFKNTSRPSAYDVSPYDETLLIDADYIIQNSTLNAVWGSVEDIMINRDAVSLMHKPLAGDEFRLNEYGIRMYWATVIYFKKVDSVRVLFNMVKHIQDHWAFYKLVYNFPSKMFRNDYAFSIAIHTLSGFLENTEIKPLPISKILSATDRDQIYKIYEDGTWVMFANELDPNLSYKFYVTKFKGVNIHCMNKLSLMNNIDALERTI
jgi:hypothetical protein